MAAVPYSKPGACPRGTARALPSPTTKEETGLGSSETRNRKPRNTHREVTAQRKRPRPHTPEIPCSLRRSACEHVLECVPVYPYTAVSLVVPSPRGKDRGRVVQHRRVVARLAAEGGEEAARRVGDGAFALGAAGQVEAQVGGGGLGEGGAAHARHVCTRHLPRREGAAVEGAECGLDPSALSSRRGWPR